MPQNSAELMEAALLDLVLAAAPFRDGRGMSRQRQQLDSAVRRAREVLRCRRQDGNKPDLEALRRLATQADREAAANPGHRKDLDG